MSQNTTFGLMINTFKAIANSTLTSMASLAQKASLTSLATELYKLSESLGGGSNTKFSWMDAIGKIHVEKFNLPVSIKSADLSVSHKVTNYLKNSEAVEPHRHQMVNCAIDDKRAMADGTAKGAEQMRSFVRSVSEEEIADKAELKAELDNYGKVQSDELTLEEQNTLNEFIENDGKVPEDDNLTLEEQNTLNEFIENDGKPSEKDKLTAAEEAELNQFMKEQGLLDDKPAKSNKPGKPADGG